MQGLLMSSWSRVWIVFSSMSRAPASQAATMFCAICVCGPAATPQGVSSSTPYSRRRSPGPGRGVKTASRGTPKTDPCRSSSVKAQSVSCSMERGRKRSDMGGSICIGRRVPGAGRLPRGRSVSYSRACRRAACSRALARTSSGSTRVGRPSSRTTSPSTTTRSGRMPGVKATCQASMGSYDQVTSSAWASGTSRQPLASQRPGRLRAGRDVHRALQHVGQPEGLEHVAADAVRAERHGVGEARRVGVADRVVEVGHGVVEDRAVQAGGRVGRCTQWASSQSSRVRPANRRGASRSPTPSQTWTCTPDAEVGCQPGRRLQGGVGAGEGGVDAHEAASPGAQEPLVLLQPAPRPIGPVTVGDAVGEPGAHPDLGAGLGDDVQAALDGVGRFVVVHDGGGAALQRLEGAEHGGPADHLQVQRAVQAPPDELQDLLEVAGRPRRGGHAAGQRRVQVVVRADESRGQGCHPHTSASLLPGLRRLGPWPPAHHGAPAARMAAPRRGSGPASAAPASHHRPARTWILHPFDACSRRPVRGDVRA